MAEARGPNLNTQQGGSRSQGQDTSEGLVGQAAEAVRGRIDWKYLLSLALTDPGFDFSVLSALRARLLAGGAEARLLEKLLVRCRELALVKARGQQRTDATRVLAVIRYATNHKHAAEVCIT